VKITVLGSGTSQGIPVIACDCPVCTSADRRDDRLRCSILVAYKGENYVVDAGPDFRQQLLRENVKTLRAILFTHEHKDHVAGLDDVRAFNFRESRDMEIYCTPRVERALRREYHYAFEENRYPGIPELHINTIGKDPFLLPNGPNVIPVEVMHHEMPVLGFRFGDFAYITDAKTVREEEIGKLQGVKVLIVNALRREPHLSHFNEDEALEFIAKVKPEQAYLTHISHLYGKHADIERDLPSNVFVAYDGQQFEVADP
jgi:phosphoribosyl 1,2-cyclic phosphate phosphodiesterase